MSQHVHRELTSPHGETGYRTRDPRPPRVDTPDLGVICQLELHIRCRKVPERLVVSVDLGDRAIVRKLEQKSVPQLGTAGDGVPPAAASSPRLKELLELEVQEDPLQDLRW
uniref:(northern house mosquito) hypothetical protein n=1 Tax=Culex pipiens TaxID=7175 RepID=A0A8D8B6Y9_CULPI